jgi:hypothetical protein
LNSPSAYPANLLEPLRKGFNQVFRPHTLYRQTGVVLAGLVAENRIQYTLFDDTARIEKMAKIYTVVDRLSARFGKHTVYHAASLPTKLQVQHAGERGDIPKRKTELFKGENRRQRLKLPMWDMKI